MNLLFINQVLNVLYLRYISKLDKLFYVLIQILAYEKI